jgi:hypothetical protein
LPGNGVLRACETLLEMLLVLLSLEGTVLGLPAWNVRLFVVDLQLDVLTVNDLLTTLLVLLALLVGIVDEVIARPVNPRVLCTRRLVVVLGNDFAEDAPLIVFDVEIDRVAEADLRLDTGIDLEVDVLVLAVFDLMVGSCLVGVGLILMPDFIVGQAVDSCVEVAFLTGVMNLFNEVVHVVDPGLAIDAERIVEDLDTLGTGGRDAEPALLELRWVLIRVVGVFVTRSCTVGCANVDTVLLVAWLRESLKPVVGGPATTAEFMERDSAVTEDDMELSACDDIEVDVAIGEIERPLKIDDKLWSLLNELRRVSTLVNFSAFNSGALISVVMLDMGVDELGISD